MEWKHNRALPHGDGMVTIAYSYSYYIIEWQWSDVIMEPRVEAFMNCRMLVLATSLAT